MIWLLIASVFLYGCEKESWFKYEFDDFFGYFNTENDFEKNNDNLNWLWYRLISDDLINIYTQKLDDDQDDDQDDIDFKESIIIAKRISDKDLETFSKENIDNVNIWWVKFSRWRQVEVECNEKPLNLLYFQWKYSLNQYSIYISQWFIKVENIIYLISYATLDEKSRNEFTSSFKSIQCK